MNLYIRYFDQEALTHSVNEVVDFLTTIPDIHITPELVADLQDYAASDMPYPKRYKVRPRVYFILIKTTAATLADFKMNKKAQAAAEVSEPVIRKETKQSLLTQQRSGWYMGTIVFKRVIPIPGTSKFQYQDTRFSAYVKAESAQHCYERIVDHLKNRQDVDLRSQFPSSRGNNFTYRFLGDNLPSAPEVEAPAPAVDSPIFDGQYFDGE